MEISITLDPSKLSNPDADLRYTIPEIAEEISNNELQDDGYDYDDDNNMIIFLSSDTLSLDTASEIIKKVCNKLELEEQALKINENV